MSRETEWAVLIAYARGAGAVDHTQASMWAAAVVKAHPGDMTIAFRHLDTIAEVNGS